MKKRKILLKKRKGMALVLVIMVMMVLTILGMALMEMSLFETKTSIRQSNILKAHYIAQAGIDTVAKNIISNPTLAAGFITSNTQITGTIGEGNFTTTVSGNATSLRLTSVGKIGTAYRDTVYLDMISTPTDGTIFSNVAYANSNLDVQMNIDGPLQSSGTINAPSGYTYTQKPNSPMTLPPVTIPFITATAVPANNIISADGDYGDKDFGNSPMTFNVSTGHVLVVVFNTFSTKGDVTITGGGYVDLFVRSMITFQTSVNIANPSQLTVFIGDGGSFNMNANGTFNGYIYGPNADISIQSALTTINGAIICRSFNHGNKNTTLHYQPMNSDVNFSNVLSPNFKKNLYSNH